MEIKVHKLICDVCGKEKDLNQMYFGGQNTWQKLIVPSDEIFTIVSGFKILNFCSLDCVKKYLNKETK